MCSFLYVYIIPVKYFDVWMLCYSVQYFYNTNNADEPIAWRGLLQIKNRKTCAIVFVYRDEFNSIKALKVTAPLKVEAAEVEA